MLYNHLRIALDEYAAFLTYAYSSSVQVKSGALKSSIRVTAVVNDYSYSLTLSVLDYWKFIPQVFPWNRAEIAAGLPPSPISLSRRAYWDNGIRYNVDFSHWQAYLNSAFELDVQDFLNSLQ